jgi:hypothetical protein
MACRIFLGGGEANTDPATAPLNMPVPTNPERRNRKLCTTHFMYFIKFIRQVQTVAYSKCPYNKVQYKIIYNKKIYEL